MTDQLSNQVIDYIQCPKCRAEGRDNSGNNLAVYADGHGKCWAGHGFVKNHILKNILKNQSKEYLLEGTNLLMNTQENNLGNSLSSLPTLSWPEYPDLDYREWRGVTAETMKFFDVKSNDDLIIYPWGAEARLVRRKDKKEFFWEGRARESQGLFGMERFVSGHGFVISITEGALDAMSLYQALGGKYPCVSVKSASTALADCTREFEWLNGFEKIKLCLDWDAPGQEAAAQVAKLFDNNKVYWVRP